MNANTSFYARIFIATLIASSLLFSCASDDSHSPDSTSPAIADIGQFAKIPTTTPIPINSFLAETLVYGGSVKPLSETQVVIPFAVESHDTLSFMLTPVNALWTPRITLAGPSGAAVTLDTAQAPSAGEAAVIPSSRDKSIKERLAQGVSFPVKGSYSLTITNLDGNLPAYDFLLTVHIIKAHKSTSPDPGNTKPNNSKPNNSKPNNSKPNNSTPNNSKPNNSKPNNSKPNNSKPNNSNPDTPFKGLQGSEVLSKFRTLNNHKKTPSYKGARQQMFSKIDNHSGTVECVYTGRTIHTSGIPQASNMNAEHTWPQSKGGDGNTKSDLHHLFPTDSKANSRRGSHPFCEVSGSPSWSEGGSKLGKDKNGRTCFEPRDSHKGNVARAMFYIAAYKNLHIDSQQEAFLRKWHTDDPVDQAERDREEAVYQYLNSHNYFIIYPEIVSQVSDF